jgi:serine/threonine-protein kinase
MNVPAADRTGQQLGNYRILSLLGQGGMGAVYLAEHEVLGRRAAIKILLPHLSINPELVARFFVEARATARLRHPSFVEVFDSGTLPDGSAYLAMEHLTGETLGECLDRRRRLPVREALTIARAIAEAVSHAHRAGILHRDLKPDNVFLVSDAERSSDGAEPRLKILDFGIAKLTNNPNESGSQTRTGVILGTPLYMSPEQCRGISSEIDHRTDVYALGCILHMMLAGQPPFPFQGFAEIVSAHLVSPPPRLRTLDVTIPGSVETLVLRLLAKEPDARPASMAAAAEELRALQATIGNSTAVAAPARPSATAPAADAPALPAARSSGALSTFRSAASAIEEAPVTERVHRGVRWPWVVAGVAAAVVAGGAWLLRTRAMTQAADPRAALTAVPPVREIPRPAVLPPDASPPPPAAVAHAPMVTLTIKSVPPGARVFDARTNELLGLTPLRRPFARATDEAQLSLRKDGFRPRRLSVPLDQDREVSLTLDARPAAAPQPQPEQPSDDDRRKL